MTAEAFAYEVLEILLPGSKRPPDTVVGDLVARIRERDEALRAYRSELPTLTEEPEETEPWLGIDADHIIRGED